MTNLAKARAAGTVNYSRTPNGVTDLDPLTTGTNRGAAIKAAAGRNMGTATLLRLALSGSVADKEKFVVGGDNFLIRQYNTDTDADAAAHTAVVITLTLKTAPATAVVLHEVLRIGSEYLIVKEVLSTTEFTVQRGAFGSTAAAITDGTDVFRTTVNDEADGEAIPLVTDSLFLVPVGATLTQGTVKTPIGNALKFWQTGYKKSRTLANEKIASLVYDATIGGASDHAIYLAFEGPEDLSYTRVVGTTETATNIYSEAMANATLTKFEGEGPEDVKESKAVRTLSGTTTPQYFTFPFTPTFVKARLYEADLSTKSGTNDNQHPVVTLAGRTARVASHSSQAYADTDILVVEASG